MPRTKKPSTEAAVPENSRLKFLTSSEISRAEESSAMLRSSDQASLGFGPRDRPGCHSMTSASRRAGLVRNALTTHRMEREQLFRFTSTKRKEPRPLENDSLVI